MAEQDRGVRNISLLKICSHHINFDDVLPAIDRIKKKIEDLDVYGRYHDVTQLHEIVNCFCARQIEITGENNMTMGHEVFWACVCLERERVLCKPIMSEEPFGEVNPKITIEGGQSIPATDRQNYRQRIERVCNAHNPLVTVQWPKNW